MKFSMQRAAIAATAGLFFLPLIADAQTLSTVQVLIVSIANIVRLVIPLLIGLAVIAFFWGLVKYIFGKGSSHEGGGHGPSAQGLMVGGIIALFVMVTVWGLVALLAQNLGVPNTGAINPPQVNGL